MSKTSNFAAVDLGASSGRVVLGTIADSTLTLNPVHRFFNGGVRTLDEYHWPTMHLWKEIKAGVAEAAGQEPLHGIGIDTWGVDFALLGRGDVLLGNPYMYRDPRTNGIFEKAFEIVPREEIFERTGIQFMQFNTIFQLLAMKQADSPLLEMAETLLMMPDLFNFWFTGRKRVEFSDATTTQLYDPRAGGWSAELIGKFGFPQKIFGEIVPSGTVLGPMREDIREELGIGNSVSIIAPASHDTGSAVAAVPASKDRPWAYISSGTWSLMGVEVKEPIINETSSQYNFTNEGGFGGTYRFLKNIAGLWLIQECKRTWEQAGKTYTFARLAEMAATAKPFVGVIDPDDPVFIQPGDMPARINDYLKNTGQETVDDYGQMTRICLESLAMAYRQTLERIEECTGQRIEVIHLLGGGVQNKTLCRWTADTTGRPVIAGPVEATAAGNVCVQAVAAGVLPDIWAAREMIRDSFEMTTYEPGDTSKWDNAYQRFTALRS
jgi:rhamnulokinase